MRLAIVLFLLLTATAVMAAEFRLPAEAQVSIEQPADGRSWRQMGTIPLAYPAARSRMALALRRQGWVMVKAVDYDQVRWKALEIWANGSGRIMVQYWREELGVTGFAWGFIKDEKRR